MNPDKAMTTGAGVALAAVFAAEPALLESPTLIIAVSVVTGIGMVTRAIPWIVSALRGEPEE